MCVGCEKKGWGANCDSVTWLGTWEAEALFVRAFVRFFCFLPWSGLMGEWTPSIPLGVVCVGGGKKERERERERQSRSEGVENGSETGTGDEHDQGAFHFQGSFCGG